MSNTLKLGNGKWATGKDTVLSFSDTNNNYKPLAFSFSRASSGTVVNKAGLIETVGSGKPRIDFKDNTKGALLLEPQRSNLVIYSEAFDSAFWTKSNATVTSNNIISPDGTLSASSIAFTTGGYLLESITTTKTIGSSETISVFSKTDVSGTFLKYGGGTASGTDVENKESFGNGWYRYSVTRTFTEAETASTQIIISSAEVGLNTVIYGVQVEQGSYATSYIPTSGSAVTRVADVSSQTLPSSVFNSYPFSVFTEVDVVDTSTGYIFSLLKLSSSAEYFTIEYFSNVWHITARPNGSTQRITSTTTVSKGTHKIVGVWESSSMKLYLNGSLIASGSNSQSFNSQVNSMLLGQLRISGDTGSRNTIRQTYLYNNALTDAEAIALTS